MQRIIYKYADKTLFAREFRDEKGDGIVLEFPRGIEGVCHFGKQAEEIRAGRANFDTKALVRGTFGVYLTNKDGKIPADPLAFSDGKVHPVTSPEMGDILYELALLKDATFTLSAEVERLTNAVFHTVIF